MSGLPEDQLEGFSRRSFLSSLAIASAAVVGLDGGATAAVREGLVVPEAVPVPLPYDLDGASYNWARSAANLDGHGWSFPAEQLPSGRTRIAGVPFDFPADDSYGPGGENFTVAKGQTIDLPQAGYALLYLIGAATGGSVDAKGEVLYADGGSMTVPVRFSDWAQVPGFLEAVVVEAGHRHRASGDAAPRVRLFLQTIPFDPQREAVGFRLPRAKRLKLIAASAQPAVLGTAVKVTAVASPQVFTGSEQAPQQVVHVSVANIGTQALSSDDPAIITLTGEGITTPHPVVLPDLAPGHQETVEVSVAYASQHEQGTELRAHVHATTQDVTDTQSVRITAAEPGWTMYMVPHYHYDPVWWNTQGAYTETWENTGFQRPGFTLVRAHLDMARRDPDYKFVLAELDYLKPFWDTFPEDRPLVRRLVEEGRLEFVGGLYNEPNTNLTSVELTIRSAVYGMGYQRDVLGGSPRTAWQLDVFGHDPQFPGIMADAGHSSSSWARGPHHEWGPKQTVGDNKRMQFRSEFDWIAPSGTSLLTSYMPNHYSAGWRMDTAKDLLTAEATAYDLFRDLKSVAATRNCLLPVGTDYAPPNRWVTRVHRSWASRYVWPKFVIAVPSEFFDAVREELDANRIALSPQTRDMNPIFTGKDITYIDTKQAQREAENTLLAAERFATIAALLGAAYPARALDKAWRQLCFGAHHDAITGSECDQVYLDLLGGWREALELGRTTLGNAQAFIAAHADTRGPGIPLLVFNAMAWRRTDVVLADIDFPAPGPAGIALRDPNGSSVPVHVERISRHHDGTIASARLAFIARDVPATGYATYHLTHVGAPLHAPAWRPAPDRPLQIENEYYSVAVDPARGGVISSLYDKTAQRQMLRAGGSANELLAYDEYEDGPGAPSGGPWVTVPKGGPIASSSQRPAKVAVEHCPIGRRITVAADFVQCRYTQEITLWDGVARVDLTTRIDDFTGVNRLMRVRFQPDVEGGMPVCEVGDAVVGRGFGFPNVDYAHAKWTLDYPAYNWVELGSTLTVALLDGGPEGAVRASRAVSVAEVVVPARRRSRQVSYSTDYNDAARDTVVALVATGVTATTSTDDGSRYGSLDVDSNLPDVRISVGGPDENDFTADVLGAAHPSYAAELRRQLRRGRTALLWVPAERPLAETWVPLADLRGPRALPVLIVAGRTPADTRTAMHELAGDLRRAPRIDVIQPAELDGTTGRVEPYGFAVLNRGLPGFNVDTTGDIYLGIMRSSTGWPSGGWIDPPQRSLPDGANFQTNHWSHTFRYAIVGHSGDWRAAGLARRGHAYNNPLTARQEGTHAGALPAGADLLSVDGDSVVVTALKPRGNPIASMAGAEADPAAGIVLRAYESSGRPTTARFTFFRPFTEATTVNMLEGDPRPVSLDGGRISCELSGFEIRTLGAVPMRPVGSGPTARVPFVTPEIAPVTEPATPVYTSYWRHNKGAAPMGYQMISVHASPGAVSGRGPYELRVTVASSHTGGNIAGEAEILVPPGWTASPPKRLYSLAPGAYLRYKVRVQPSGPGGRYFVFVRTTDPQGQLHEDVVTIEYVASGRAASVPAEPPLPGSEPTRPVHDGAAERALSLSIDKVTRKARMVLPSHPERTHQAQELATTLVTPEVTVAPGQTGRLTARLHNTAQSPIHGEAQLITPYAIWPITTPWTQPFTVVADGDTDVHYEFAAPPGSRPGSWWALVKVMYFGRLLYTPTAVVAIGEASGRPSGEDSDEASRRAAPAPRHSTDRDDIPSRSPQ
ncbi:glycosyl hydrolase-related protein [Streptomyces sp. RB6PN25]|uniref:Glycosyl hydrolase-related protein n=1 Tax=Streptomyces humicola TaxID=2953240 RepID=A0ABT1PZZ9_9ACTN|nr:glycoside hydrolase family 38 C-terminal domain-containing protein [Streptomyces humicola]MCQ4083246.1 glycosyl hydrolase-related protein [Streptomyces humicola]